jgi:beta-lactamase regulating signal transducer with metallopeptidase domain
VTALLDVWSAYVVASLTESLALIAVIWIVDRLLQRRLWPEVRHGLWLLALLKLLLPPGIVPTPGILSAAAVDVSSAVSIDAAAPATTSLFWLWLAGVLVIAAGWYRRSVSAAARLHDVAGPASTAAATRRVADEARALQVRRPIAVRVDPEAALPYVTGLLRPRVVLPADWRTWTPATLSHAIGHELCHLSRRDLWLEAAWMAIAALYWFHPLVHVARRRAHAARELCCDADAARLYGRAYRESLLQLAGRAAFGDRATLKALPQLHHSWGPVIVRLQALERSGPVSRRRRVGGLAAILTAAAITLPSWTTFDPPAAANDIEAAVLLDPVRRQEAGLGSMHVRYQLLRLSQQQGSDR